MSRAGLARRIAVNLGLALLTTGLMLLALEFLVRQFSDWGTSMFEKDPIVGQRYLPDFAGDRFIPEGGQIVHLRFNSLGFRGPEWSEKKPPGVRRLALLGDSFTASIAVQEADTMAVRLANNLDSDPANGRWEVMNFGIGGFSTAQSLLTWRNFAKKFHPDLVVLCFYNGNDLWDNHRGLTSYPRPYFSLAADGSLIYEPMSAAGVSITRWLNLHSHLYTWQKQRILELRGALRGATTDAPNAMEAFDTEPPPPFPEAWRLAGALIGTLADEVRATGAQFVLVSIAAHEEIFDDYWQRVVSAAGARAPLYERDHPEKMLAAVASEKSFPFIRLDESFRADPNPTRLHFGGGHWNAEGNQLAAEAIYEQLLPLLPGR